MSTRLPGVIPFHRPARLFPAPVPTASIRMAPPPQVRKTDAGPLVQILFPVVGGASLVGFSFVYRQPLLLYIGIGIAALMLLVGLTMRIHTKRQAKEQRRENAIKYRAYLEGLRKRLEGVARTQGETARRLHPDIEGLWSRSGSRPRATSRTSTHSIPLAKRQRPDALRTNSLRNGAVRIGWWSVPARYAVLSAYLIAGRRSLR